jgi:hypothetical protein
LPNQLSHLQSAVKGLVSQLAKHQEFEGAGFLGIWEYPEIQNGNNHTPDVFQAYLE